MEYVFSVFPFGADSEIKKVEIIERSPDKIKWKFAGDRVTSETYKTQISSRWHPSFSRAKMILLEHLELEKRDTEARLEKLNETIMKIEVLEESDL